MQAERTQHELQSVLQQEAICSEQLLDTLDAERAALVNRDIDALEIAIQHKLKHSQQLDKLDRQRGNILSGLGFASDHDSIKRCFESLPNAGELTGLWQQVLDNVSKCQIGNLTNGGILEAGRQQVDQALRILRGQHGTPTLYNPLGETSADLGRRELGKV
ncbi:MAG: flagellar protein FlgN [Thiogranum sp.]|nr:flagellar protein FlgN [Thiogranum sp.]